MSPNECCFFRIFPQFYQSDERFCHLQTFLDQKEKIAFLCQTKGFLKSPPKSDKEHGGKTFDAPS